MSLKKVETIPLTVEEDILHVRHTVRDIMAEQKFSLIEQTNMVTATSELSRNTLIHGGGGTAIIEVLNYFEGPGIRVTFEDQGPGIANIEKALSDGFTTGRGLGLGLGGSKRLVHQFDIHSEIGRGTRVSITMLK
jgi:serine/threonine-protein kinase RsbT